MSWIDSIRAGHVQTIIGGATDPAVLAARKLHAEVYIRSGFLTDGVNWIDLQSGLVEDHWVEAATYVAVLGEEGPVGTARLISSDQGNGLPTFNNFEMKPAYSGVEPRDCLEISSFAIGGETSIYSGVFAQLFRGFLKVTASRPERYWVAIVERPLLRIMRRLYGLPFEEMGDPLVFMGGETVPIILDVHAYVTGLNEKRRAYLEELIDRDELEHWISLHSEAGSSLSAE